MKLVNLENKELSEIHEEAIEFFNENILKSKGFIILFVPKNDYENNPCWHYGDSYRLIASLEILKRNMIEELF